MAGVYAAEAYGTIGLGAGGPENGPERAILDARRQRPWLWSLEDREFTVREISVEDARWLAE